jgi:uncharacterized protein (TIGR02145 family)
MASIKTFLTGLVGVSLCMADISGIVTDTGATPLAGAVVQLEKGGQTATTGADGRFTLILSTAILPGNGNPVLTVYSYGIFGNKFNMRIAERAAIKVTTFDISGKALSMVHKTLDAGNHSLSLPCHGTGIYLYKVNLGNSEFVLKGTTVSAVASGSALSSRSTTSRHVAKPSMNIAVNNDVITVTKPGYLNYRREIDNFNTSGMVLKMIESAGTVSDTDGNVYQTVRIGNQEWMAENLRTTRYNDGTSVPLVKDSAAWTNLTTPAYCFYDTTIDADSIKKYGALYNWYVVNPTNPKKIAPAGWHVPSYTEWDTLQNYLIAHGYNWDGTTAGNKVAKALAAKTDWSLCNIPGSVGAVGNDVSANNSTGFSALPGGYRNRDGGFSDHCRGYWWSATEFVETIAWYRSLLCSTEDLYGMYFNKPYGFSVRLLRD